MKQGTSKAVFKKKRNAARDQAGNRIQTLADEFGLTRYEVAHAIFDKLLDDVDNAAGSEPSITPGLAETYLSYVKPSVSDNANKPVLSPTQAGFKGLIDYCTNKGEVFTTKFGDELPGPSTKGTLTEADFTDSKELKLEWKPTADSPWVSCLWNIDKGTDTHWLEHQYATKLPDGYIFSPVKDGKVYIVPKTVPF